VDLGVPDDWTIGVPVVQGRNAVDRESGSLQGSALDQPLLIRGRVKRVLLVSLLLLTGTSSAWADPPRSIKRTHRTIVSAALAMERSDSTKGIEELRKAIVRNAAARIGLKKAGPRVAMFLTLEGRRIARSVLAGYGETNNKGAEADAEESEAAAGGEGKEAEAAVAEAEKQVPGLDELKKQIPDVDRDDVTMQWIGGN